MCAPAPPGSGGAGGAGGGGAAISGACNFTPRSLRRKLRDMAVEISGESNGSKALRTLRGGDDSWIRDSFVKLYRVRADRGQARAAVEEIKSQYGVELGCVEPAAAGPGDMQTSLSTADAGMDTELSIDPSMAPGMDPELQTPVAPTSASSQYEREQMASANKRAKQVARRSSGDRGAGMLDTARRSRNPYFKKALATYYSELYGELPDDLKNALEIGGPAAGPVSTLRENTGKKTKRVTRQQLARIIAEEIRGVFLEGKEK